MLSYTTIIQYLYNYIVGGIKKYLKRVIQVSLYLLMINPYICLYAHSVLTLGEIFKT